MKISSTSLLIITPSVQNRLEKAQELSPFLLKTNNPDSILIDTDETIGIDEIKALNRQLQKKPYKELYKIVFILHAQNLTLPAQNAILKTLEEPPDNTLIILAAPHPNLLLPTIISRCRIINVVSPPAKLSPLEVKEVASLLKQVSESSIAKRVSLASNFTTRKAAHQLCLNLIIFFREQMRSQPKQSNLNNLKMTLTSLSRLDQNVNPNLTLENLFINLK